MNFLTFNRLLNILFLIIFKPFNSCGQPLKSSSFVDLTNISSDLSTISPQNSNNTQDFHRILSEKEEMFSNPTTEFSTEIIENNVTNSLDERSDDISESFTTTTYSNIFNDRTTINELTDFPKHEKMEVLIIDSETNQNYVTQNNSEPTQGLDTTTTVQDVDLEEGITDSNITSIDSFSRYSDNNYDLETITSTQLPIYDTNIADNRSEPLVSKLQNSVYHYMNNSNNISFIEDKPKNDNSFELQINEMKPKNTTRVFDETTIKHIIDDLLLNESLKNTKSNTNKLNNKVLPEMQINFHPNIPFEYLNKEEITVLNNTINATSNNFDQTLTGTFESNSQTFETTRQHVLNTSQSRVFTPRSTIDLSLSLVSEEPELNINETLNSSLKSDTNEEINGKIISFKTMCAFGGWSAHRPGSGRFDVYNLERENMVLSGCSHLIYSFAALGSNSKVVSLDPRYELGSKFGTFAKLNALRKNNPNLKIMIALGGWDTPPNVWTFLLSNNTRRQKTAENIVEFIKSYSFDGIVISWLYPGAKWRGGHISDRNNLVKFLQDIKRNIANSSIELAIMGPPLKQDIDDGFDVPKISNLVDYLLLMTYDYFGSWGSTVNHLAPLYPNSNSSDNLNANFTLHYWVNKGAEAGKIVMGLATYGRTFTLDDPKNNAINALSIGPGISGPYTNRPGIMGFSEICEIFLSNSGVKLEEDVYRVTPFIHLYDQWIGFEDELSIFIKTTYALDNKLKGIFFWTMDLDDYNNKCGWGNFPLIRAALQAIYKKQTYKKSNM